MFRWGYRGRKTAGWEQGGFYGEDRVGRKGTRCLSCFIRLGGRLITGYSPVFPEEKALRRQ
ncbi:hypothetical protein CXU21_07395 [Akkermansia muciniphila]|nr:hypothetical protein CXU21_07395 [Akkermansia muciniphila]